MVALTLGMDVYHVDRDSLIRALPQTRYLIQTSDGREMLNLATIAFALAEQRSGYHLVGGLCEFTATIVNYYSRLDENRPRNSNDTPILSVAQQAHREITALASAPFQRLQVIDDWTQCVSFLCTLFDSFTGLGACRAIQEDTQIFVATVIRFLDEEGSHATPAWLFAQSIGIWTFHSQSTPLLTVVWNSLRRQTQDRIVDCVNDIPRDSARGQTGRALLRWVIAGGRG